MPARLVDRLPISVKLPLMMGGLMVLMHAVMSTVAVLEVRTLAIRAASDRLTSVSTQIATMLQTQGRQLIAFTDSIARNDTLRSFVRRPGLASRTDALEALAYDGRQASQVMATQLRDAYGRLLIETGPLAGRLADSVLRGLAAGPGPLVRHGDSIVIPVVAAITDGSNRIGTYTQWRLFGGTAAGRASMSRLIGTGATVLVGSPSTDVWTDLEKASDGPPASTTLADSGTTSYQRAGEEQLAAATPVPGTPWMVVVEFPRALVMQPVWQVFRRRLIVTTVVLLAGLLVAWQLSRHITVPLAKLTSGVESMSAADYAAPMNWQREDELGRLALAFDRAAERVRAEQAQLEGRVERRTSELHEALVKLEETQAALVRRERLALLGQLSSGVGHELRNPLGVMTNAVYYLDAVAGNTSPKVKEYLGILRQQISLSERIVGDLLDFARVKPPQLQLVSLAAVADEQLGRLGSAPGVTVQKEYAPDAPRAMADPLQLGQIVFNLLTNAVQAMGDKGGVLLVSVGTGGAGSVRLDVRDSGPGIQPDALDKIFEPLFTTKARGIGLGLAVSRSLAANNGAELTVDSKPGQGATFSLTLPVAAAGSAAA